MRYKTFKDQKKEYIAKIEFKLWLAEKTLIRQRELWEDMKEQERKLTENLSMCSEPKKRYELEKQLKEQREAIIGTKDRPGPEINITLLESQEIPNLRRYLAILKGEK